MTVTDDRRIQRPLNIHASAGYAHRSLLADLYSLIVLVAVLMSWVRLDPRNPLTMMVRSLTEPVLAPIRNVLPPIGGLDFSPLVLLTALQVLNRDQEIQLLLEALIDPVTLATFDCDLIEGSGASTANGFLRPRVHVAGRRS